MELTNDAGSHNENAGLDKKSKLTITQLIAPLAPHFAEEVWQNLHGAQTSKKENSVFDSKWPTYNEKFLVADTILVPVQVNGRLRATLEVLADSTKAHILKEARANHNVKVHLGGKKPFKEIYIPGKIVNLVVKS
jgi:leucyl-tRNA synthetase